MTEQQQYVISVKFLEFIENVKKKKNKNTLFLTSPIERKSLLRFSSLVFSGDIDVYTVFIIFMFSTNDMSKVFLTL